MDNSYAREPPLERPRNTSYGRPLFPVIPAENAPTSPSYEEPPSAQARKLQLRKARFRGLVVPTRNITPVGARKPSITTESPGEVQHASPYEYGSLERRQRRTLSNDLGILQEVTNSSLRRKTNTRPDISTIFQPDLALQEEAELLANTSSTNFLEAPRIATANTPRRRNPRVVSKDNLNAETTKYIEHLESQLAALQTQLQCLTSPSTTKTQSAKLRAMNSESRLLKQEIADWESKFHERIKEQLEQHEIVVSKLKAEIRHLEKEIELNHDKMQELRTQSDEKTRQLVVVESANYDLERRLEFMSELLASTSGRLDLHGDPQLGASKRGGSGRPRSVGPLRIPTPVLQQFSPQRKDRARKLQDPTRTPESPVRVGNEETNPWDRLGASTRNFDASPETASVVSENNTLVDSVVSTSPGNRRSVILSHSVNSEQDGKSRPTRRMRRFYTGSTGPRSLILPATTHAGSFPTSAPMLESPAPSFHSSIATPREGLGFKLPISPERPAMHKRSATWDDRESHSVRARRVGGITPIVEAASPFSYRLPPPAQEEGQHTPPTPTYNAPLVTSQDATPLFSDDDAQIMANRAISLSSVRGRNLFDELNRMKHDDEHEDASSAHPSSSPFRSFSGPASYAVTPLNISPQSSSTHEPGPQISPTPAPGASTAANMAAKRSTNTVIPTSSSSTSAYSSQEESSSTTAATIRAPSIIDRLLSLFALPSVKTVMSNAWSMFSLSRPVLEFRFWLIRLLLGDLKKKHARLMLLRDAATKSRVASGSGRDTMAVKPGEAAGAIGLGISHGRSVMLTTASAAPKARLMDAFDEKERPSSLLQRRQSRRSSHEEDYDALTIDDLATSAPPAEPRVSTSISTSRLAPVAWVKLSMTLVFAVGVAIKDGPASLFQAQRRGLETVVEEEDE